MYGSSCPRLHKLATKVLSQVVNSSSAKRCWSTYSFIHSMKRNRLNENREESLVYVHYNLTLLTHYCERAKTDRSYVTWDNNQKEHNLKNGALTLERLEDELLGDEDDHAIVAATAMPPPSSTLFPDAPSLPRGSTSQPPPASARRVMQDHVLDVTQAAQHWWLLRMIIPLPLFIDHGKRN